MKKTVFFLFFLVWVLRPFGAAGQVSLADTMFIRAAAYPTEWVHLHLSKDIVYAGGTIWWKGYLFEGLQPSTLSTNLYVELFSPEGRMLMQKVFPVTGSLSEGGVTFGDTLPAGIYWIRAYTRYQLNFEGADLFRVPVTVVARDGAGPGHAKVWVGPESGPFVTSLEGILLVTTPTENGLSCHVQADSGSWLLGKPLDLVLASYHRPYMRARYSLSEGRPWLDAQLHTDGLHGGADVLVFCGDSLIVHQAICLGPLPSAGIEVFADTLSTLPGGYNMWRVRINDRARYNCSVSVTDADRSVGERASILQYPGADPWDYGKAARGRFPEIRYADTDYLSWSGEVRTDRGKPIQGGELVVLISKDSAGAVKPSVLPIDGEGRFALKGGFFFDSAFVSYELNSFQNDPLAKEVQVSFDRFLSPGFLLPDRSCWKDTSFDYAGSWDRPVDTLPRRVRVRELPEVTVNGNALKELDDHYTTGIFTSPAPYAFDLRLDKTVTSIWMYLRKNLPGFQGGADVGEAPSFNGNHTVFYVDGEVRSVAQVDGFWYEEMAYVKVFNNLWLDQTAYAKWTDGDDGFSGQPTAGGLRVPINEEVSVVCIYTRKGKDIRTSWNSLHHARMPGFAPIAHWSRFSADQETVYWNPVEPGNDFSIRFYNHGAERYRICIEGVSQDGRVVHYETVISPPPSAAAARAVR